jgi:hypothetical protein
MKKKSLRTQRWDMLHKLERDNKTVGDFWFMRDCGQIVITHQKVGESPGAQVILPKRVFDRFVDFYLAEQKSVP